MANHPPRILVADDQADVLEALKLLLKGEGFEIDEAADGQAALDRVRADPPDLVFLDMNIPGSSGAEVLMQIKADPATDGVKVIIVTADGEEGRERAIGMGADEYFTKPFSPITLLPTVERVLSSPPPAG